MNGQKFNSVDLKQNNPLEALKSVPTLSHYKTLWITSVLDHIIFEIPIFCLIIKLRYKRKKRESPIYAEASIV